MKRLEWHTAAKIIIKKQGLFMDMNKTKALEPQVLALVERLEEKLRRHAANNREKYDYYYGHLAVQDLNISTPPSLKYLNVALGWGTAAVDVVAERLSFEGCYSATDETTATRLNEFYRENEIGAIQRSVLKEALITGTGYISIAPGRVEEGEPEVLIRPESPDYVTGDFNERTLRLDNALKVIRIGDELLGTLWLPNETISLIRANSASSKWRELGERNVHNLGRVTVVCLRNNYDNKYTTGRTEISRPLRGLINAAMRTLLATETAREFFAQPLRSIAGASADAFLDENGNPKDSWSMITGRILGLPFNADDNVSPTLTQLPASNPENIMGLMHEYAVLAAREIGVPPSYFGFDNTNPSSAEAINESDKKLIRKAEERQHEVARAWKQALGYAVLILDGELPEDWVNIETLFRPVETISRSAEADAMLKLSSMGLFDKPLPDLVYRKLGLKDVEIIQLKQWFKAQQGNSLIESLLTQNGAASTDKPQEPKTTGE